MVATRWRGRATAGSVLILAAVAAMVVVDVVVAGTYSSPLAAIVVTDVAVGTTVAFVHRFPFGAPVAAALLSLGASGLVRLMDWSYTFRDIGTSSWFGFGELVALAYVTALAVRVLHPAQAGVVALLFGEALGAIAVVRHSGPAADLLQVPMVVGFGVTIGIGAYLRSVDRARVRADQDVRQEERNEIARELHDVVAHHVTGIVLQAQAARLVASERPEVVDHALTAIEDAGSEALRSMRAMVGSLRADDAAPLVPTATVDDLRAIASAQPGDVEVRVSLDERLPLLPTSVVASLHRIAREALTNARRHARDATRIDVEVRCLGDEVRISVANDGAVVPGRSAQGFGLVGIAERVDALGGRFSAGPRPSGGWDLTAVLPVQAP